MTQRDSSVKYSPSISLGGHTRALAQLAELPARVPDPPALDPKLRGAAHGVVSVAPPAPPAKLSVFCFAHFRCKKGVDIILVLSKMTQSDSSPKYSL